MKNWLLGISFAALAAGCIERNVGRIAPTSGAEIETEVPVDRNRDVDLLFVVDNSRSMAAEQASLAANFFRIIDALEGDEGLPSVHIGVVTTDLGEGIACPENPNAGQLVPPSCAGASEPYLSDIAQADGSRARNYNGSLQDAFSCTAQVGDQGCGFEQPLEAMRRALENGRQNGFLREHAYLGVVFIQDEDDCSVSDTRMFGEPNSDLSSALGPQRSFRCFEYGVVCDNVGDVRAPGARQNCRPREDSPFMTSVATYSDFLRSIKPSGRTLVASIAGPTSPVSVVAQTDDQTGQDFVAVGFSCGAEGDSAQATPPIRMSGFMEPFGTNQTQASICDGNLASSVQQVANFFGARTRPCLAGDLLDQDPTTDGLQVLCNVSERRGDLEGGLTERILAECDDAAANVPCYRIQASDECADTPTGLGLEVVYADGATVPLGTSAVARCQAR